MQKAPREGLYRLVTFAGHIRCKALPPCSEAGWRGVSPSLNVGVILKPKSENINNYFF
jgi:hypothetical protein